MWLYEKYMFYVLADYEFVHDGHCNGGYITDKTGISLKGCRDHCSELPEVGYFSYSTEGEKCSCYSTAARCPDDNLYPAYNSYAIVRTGSLLNKSCFTNIQL